MDSGNALVVYSSKTGNTRKVAEGIVRRLIARGYAARIAPVEDTPRPAGGEAVLLGFWVDKGSADKKALTYLKSLTGRQIGLFGTLGAYPDSDHAKKSAQTVEELAAKKNTCLGSFMCQGKIDPKLTEMFKKIPAGLPHSMDEERRKRHEEAAKHPDDADIEAAVAACAAMLEKCSHEENS
jgi:flavodoxin